MWPHNGGLAIVKGALRLTELHSLRRCVKNAPDFDTAFAGGCFARCAARSFLGKAPDCGCRSKRFRLRTQIAHLAKLPAMREVPTVSLRTRTDDDLNITSRISADLDSWEERNPSASGPLTRAMFDERLARTAASDTSEQNATFVVDVDGAAVNRRSGLSTAGPTTRAR